MYINSNLPLKEYIIINWKTTTKVSKVLVLERALCSKRYSIDLNLFSQNVVERYTIVLSSLEKKRFLTQITLIASLSIPCQLLNSVKHCYTAHKIIRVLVLYSTVYIIYELHIWFQLSTEENKLSAHSSVASSPFNIEVFKKDKFPYTSNFVFLIPKTE